MFRIRATVVAAAITTAAAVVGLLVASGAAAAKTLPPVSVKVTLAGSGSVYVVGDPRGLFCGAGRCTRTFHVRRGERVVISASPHPGWKLTAWGRACQGTSHTCSLGRVTAARSVKVTLSPPGNRLNPYPLGTKVGLDGGWKVRVNSVTLNADPEIEAVQANPLPPAGSQYTLINVTMRNVGLDSVSLTDFLDLHQQLMTGVAGDSSSFSRADGACEPPQPDLGTAPPIPWGNTVTGNLCYLIAAKDASIILLRGWITPGCGGGCGPMPTGPVWFALNSKSRILAQRRSRPSADRGIRGSG